MTVKINENIAALLFYRAKREKKTIVQLTNELLGQALWNEPEVLFKGKHYRVEADLFDSFTPPEPSD